MSEIDTMNETEEAFVNTLQVFDEASETESKFEKLMQMIEHREDLILVGEPVQKNYEEFSSWNRFTELYVIPNPESFDPDVLQSMLNGISNYLEPTMRESFRVYSGKMQLGKLYYDEEVYDKDERNTLRARTLLKLCPNEKVAKDIIHDKLNGMYVSLDMLRKYMRWRPKSSLTPFEYKLVYGESVK